MELFKAELNNLSINADYVLTLHYHSSSKADVMALHKTLGKIYQEDIWIGVLQDYCWEGGTLKLYLCSPLGMMTAYTKAVFSNSTVVERIIQIYENSVLSTLCKLELDVRKKYSQQPLVMQGDFKDMDFLLQQLQDYRLLAFFKWKNNQLYLICSDEFATSPCLTVKVLAPGVMGNDEESFYYLRKIAKRSIYYEAVGNVTGVFPNNLLQCGDQRYSVESVSYVYTYNDNCVHVEGSYVLRGKHVLLQNGTKAMIPFNYMAKVLASDDLYTVEFGNGVQLDRVIKLVSSRGISLTINNNSIAYLALVQQGTGIVPYIVGGIYAGENPNILNAAVMAHYEISGRNGQYFRLQEEHGKAGCSLGMSDSLIAMNEGKAFSLVFQAEEVLCVAKKEIHYNINKINVFNVSSAFIAKEVNFMAKNSCCISINAIDLVGKNIKYSLDDYDWRGKNISFMAKVCMKIISIKYDAYASKLEFKSGAVALKSLQLNLIAAKSYLAVRAKAVYLHAENIELKAKNIFIPVAKEYGEL